MMRMVTLKVSSKTLLVVSIENLTPKKSISIVPYGAIDDDDDDDEDEDEATNQVVSQAIIPAAAAAVVPGPDAVSDGSGIDTKVDVQSLNEDNGVQSASIGSAEKGQGAGLGVGHHHHHQHHLSFGHHKGSGSSSSSGSEEGDDDIVVGDYIDTERKYPSENLYYKLYV